MSKIKQLSKQAIPPPDKNPNKRSHSSASQGASSPAAPARKKPRSDTLQPGASLHDDDNADPSKPSHEPSETSQPDRGAVPNRDSAGASTALPWGSLAGTYDVTTMSIVSSSSIQQKVTRVLEVLSAFPPAPREKPRLVMLHAKAKAVAKMISIAEIAKRDIAEREGKWFQYNRIGEVMTEKVGDVRKVDNAGKGKQAVELDEEESDEESTAFETMKTPFERKIEGRAKVVAVPVMNLYLSRIRVDGLRKNYGLVFDIAHPTVHCLLLCTNASK
jgi:hypothetical protein